MGICFEDPGALGAGSALGVVADPTAARCIFPSYLEIVNFVLVTWMKLHAKCWL